MKYILTLLLVFVLTWCVLLKLDLNVKSKLEKNLISDIRDRDRRLNNIEYLAFYYSGDLDHPSYLCETVFHNLSDFKEFQIPLITRPEQLKTKPESDILGFDVTYKNKSKEMFFKSDGIEGFRFTPDRNFLYFYKDDPIFRTMVMIDASQVLKVETILKPRHTPKKDYSLHPVLH